MSSLQLDPRQQAMLEEMRIPFWWPEPPGSPEASGEPAATDTRPAPPRQEPPVRPAPAVHAPAAVRPVAPVMAPAPTQPRTTTAAPSDSAWQLRPAQALYGSPAGPGGWLLVTEAIWPGDQPLAEAAGAAGRLLDNMLRAMRLHQNPRVWLAGMERRAGATGPLGHGELLQSQRPAVIVLMGRHAVREWLGTDEPLGRLRGRVHEVQGVPAIATYDAPYLLRTQADKARAWGDLCLALAEMAKG